MKKSITLLLALLIAGSSTAAVVYKRMMAKVEYKNCPTSVDYVVKYSDGSHDGIGLFTLKVLFGDDASAANTFNLLEIDRISGVTNTILGPEVFTNSFIYAPTPIFVASGNTLRFENSETGADISFAYETY